jgi:hypothetical protein
MVATKTKLVFIIFVAQLLVSTLTVSAQTAASLRGRIPKPDPKKYQAIRDGKDWQNPKILKYLFDLKGLKSSESPLRPKASPPSRFPTYWSTCLTRRGRMD